MSEVWSSSADISWARFHVVSDRARRAMDDGAVLLNVQQREHILTEWSREIIGGGT